MTAEEARLLFAYDAWANARQLEACRSLTPEQFTQPLGSSFSSVRDTLVHILGAQRIWCERLHGRAAGMPKPEEFPDIAALGARWAEIERDLLGYVNALSNGDIEGGLDYHDMKGNAYRSARREILQHLVNHGTYHRGQVTTLLRQLGAKPANTDLIRFYRELAAEPVK